ncbi:unnamed protein product [Owenia fusiformis]|uniref:Uncharacterized protein n=1 Tax=Owenia fusiformis TaxID=6347 RepID=A0A8J1U970_OWEFU|nr:unnamed protein product [Owenia fusiformis]
MPSLTPPLLVKTKYVKISKYFVPPLWKTFKDRPPVLKNNVSAKKEKSKVAPCVEEMSLMFSCWKNHDFETKRCQKEIEAFNKCYSEANLIQKEKLELEAKGLIGTKGKATSKQINSLLAKYPTPTS